ncbi:MAG TPA: pyridoxamine 5'-phosphate oxidase family protein [Mycobacterium sp.]
MIIDPREPGADVLAFLTERHLASLTTLRGNGSPHVIAVGFTYDVESGIARVITGDGSVKVRNAERPRTDDSPNRAAVCQVDGRRWLTLEGTVGISRDPDQVADAERRYGLRYRTPRINPRRVVLTIAVDKIMGHT